MDSLTDFLGLSHLHKIIIFLLFFGCISESAEIRPKSTTSTPLTYSTIANNTPPTISYFAEFEIVEYWNLEGRLMNGECCSGYKSSIGHGLCRGGNSSCNPYWKICLTHAGENTKSGLSAIPSDIQSLYRYDPKASLKAASKQANTRQWAFKNFFNRLMTTFKVMNGAESSVQSEKSSASNKLSSTCSIAYWNTDITKNNLSRKNPIKLRARIPLLTILKTLRSNSKVNSMLKDSSLNQSDLNSSVQRVGILVEVWSKQKEGDKLIARKSQVANTTLQIIPNDESHWEETSSSDTLTNINTSSSSSPSLGIRFKYRWRLVADLKDANGLENITVECPSGYSGVDCSEPICKKGCHSSHGYCSQPNECRCKFGWTGEFCSICMPMPGCIHGSCSKPFECRCEQGWSGMFCDKPSCKLGCHPQNGYCEHPGECRCRFGYQGENCTECATMPGCQNGDCKRPLDCNCFPGWMGMFCNIPICSDGCDLEHGWCRRPDECRCRIGWSGRNCSDCVPYPGCLHGSCSSPWTCDCEPGWGGVDCRERLDFCEKHKPCKNNGTCISIEKSDGGFLCRCAPSFEGKKCEKSKR